MARALARGWGEPVLVSDAGSGRAQALVDELGGEAFQDNAEVARRADVVVLCHKPYQLAEVASEIREHVKVLASVLGGVSLEALQTRFRDAQVFVFMPNTPVELRQGVVIYAQAERHPHVPGGPPSRGPYEFDPAVEARLLELFGRLGRLVTVPERLLDVAGAISGVGPAYQALLAEAQVDAAVRRGLPAGLAAELVCATMTGSAALLAARGYDTLGVRRAVTSPGGSTARGLRALERGGLRSAFEDAIDAVTPPQTQTPAPERRDQPPLRGRARGRL